MAIMLTVRGAIEKRRSIRKYKLDPVPQEFINQLLESARLAPSGANRQPWRFRVVKDPDTKAKLKAAAFSTPANTIKRYFSLIFSWSGLEVTSICSLPYSCPLSAEVTSFLRFAQ